MTTPVTAIRNTNRNAQTPTALWMSNQNRRPFAARLMVIRLIGHHKTIPDSDSSSMNTPAHETMVLPVSPERRRRCTWWIWPSQVGPVRVPRISPVYSLTNTMVPPALTDHDRSGATPSP